MKTQKFIKIFKTASHVSAMPDISAYTDDILGPNMSDPIPKVHEKIRMLKRKRRVAPFLDPVEHEEENEEGELDSGPEPEKLSNHEQGLQHGFNPHAKQKAKQWDQFKNTDITTIPNIVATGVGARSPITPNYSQIKDLPQYIKGPVRALEKQLFNLITTTPADDIQVIAHVDGDGPNSEDELHAVTSWLRQDGEVDHELIKDIEKRIKGLELIHTEGITHLVVDNSAGQFVFSWPSVDNQIGKRIK